MSRRTKCTLERCTFVTPSLVNSASRASLSIDSVGLALPLIRSYLSLNLLLYGSMSLALSLFLYLFEGAKGYPQRDREKLTESQEKE